MKFQDLLEKYGMMKREQRMFYPKNFTLSETFLKSLNKEIEEHRKAGIDPKKFHAKFSRALQFHIDEHYQSNKKPSN